jgi:phenylacetate-CoA ligase
MIRLPLSLSARSAVPGLSFPAIVRPEAAQLYSSFLQLERSQWLAEEALQEIQRRQLDALLAHVWATVPGYHHRLREAGLLPGEPFAWDAWDRIPVLTRRELQLSGNALHSLRVPPEHGPVEISRTSGSSGEPVEVLRTALDFLMSQATTLRDHAWHRRDLTGMLCAIRAGVSRTPDGESIAGWGPATDRLFETGRSAALPIDTVIAEQARWLQQRKPDYLLIYPTAFAALLRWLREQHIALPQLREVRTVGEVLPPGTRSLCAEVLRVPVVDLYSSQEVGDIALQCPDSGLYHVQSENLLVEILDDAGRRCEPGETGRVVLTTLHSFAMPLLRYELRDFAEVSEPCPCGRGLPALRRIQGRVRNMLIAPDGNVRWPLVGFAEYRNAAPVRQYQIAQTARDRLEFRLVVERPLSPGEEADLAAILRRALGDFAAIEFRYFSDLPLGPNGKFEEFVCLISE